MTKIKDLVEPLKRIAATIERNLEYNITMISKEQRQEANILWIYKVLRVNLGAIKRVKLSK